MNGTFRLSIELGNDDMQTPQDLAQALREMAAKIESKDLREEGSGKILDDNGNTVGDWELDTEDEDEDEDGD